MRVGAFFLVATSASALALRAGPHTRRPPRRAKVCSCTAPPPPEGEGGHPPEATPSHARKALERAVGIDAEVLPPSYFESLRYDEDDVPWDLFGLPQAAVRNAAQSGAFGPAGTVILDCGCGSGDNANWLAANHGYEVLGFDLSANAFGFTVDPADPYSVRFFVRNSGKHVGPWQPWGALPPTPLSPRPGQDLVRGPTEAAMLTFDPSSLAVRFFTTGNVVKFGDHDVNTGGLGAVLGLFHAIGYGSVGSLALDANVRGLANFAAGVEGLKIPKTRSVDPPAWWKAG